MRLKKTLVQFPLLFLWLRRSMYAMRAMALKRAPFFRRYPVQLDASMLNRRGAVSRSPGFIYFRIPKAANSTISITLQAVLKDATAGDVKHPSHAKSQFLPLSALTAGEVDRLRERFFTFTFVRNPYTRIASAYLDKIRGDKPPKLLVARWYGRSPREPISFAEFCDYLQDGKGYLEDGHWARQTDLIPLPVEQLDFIGHIESLEQDLRHVVVRLFGPGHDFHVVSWQGDKTGASSRTRSLYTEREQAMVRNIYAGDFRSFGYDPESLP